MIEILFSYLLCSSSGCDERMITCLAESFAYDGAHMVAECAGRVSCPGTVEITGGVLRVACSAPPLFSSGFETQ